MPAGDAGDGVHGHGPGDGISVWFAVLDRSVPAGPDRGGNASSSSAHPGDPWAAQPGMSEAYERLLANVSRKHIPLRLRVQRDRMVVGIYLLVIFPYIPSSVPALRAIRGKACLHSSRVVTFWWSPPSLPPSPRAMPYLGFLGLRIPFPIHPLPISHAHL